MIKRETVTIIHQHPEILLGMKKVRFGKGRYNGFGGRVKSDESLIESAIRETKEEAGITIIDPEIKGNIYFRFQSEEPDHDVHFIRATRYRGEPIETEEMRPERFHVDKIPYEQMWPDDRYWLPLLLEGKFFIGEFKFNLEGKIATYEIKVVSRLYQNA